MVCSALIRYTFFVCLLLTRCYLIRFFGLFFAFHYGSHVNFFFISYSLFFRICSLTAKLAMYRHLYKLPPLINYEWLNFNFTFKIHTLAYLLFFVTFSNCCVFALFSFWVGVCLLSPIPSHCMYEIPWIRLFTAAGRVFTFFLTFFYILHTYTHTHTPDTTVWAPLRILSLSLTFFCLFADGSQNPHHDPSPPLQHPLPFWDDDLTCSSFFLLEKSAKNGNFTKGL